MVRMLRQFKAQLSLAVFMILIFESIRLTSVFVSNRYDLSSNEAVISSDKLIREEDAIVILRGVDETKDRISELSESIAVRSGSLQPIVVKTNRPIVNPHPFIYLLNCPDICKDKDIFLLNYIHTSVGHFAERKRIRETWANESNYPTVKMKTVFLVGAVVDEDWKQAKLERESKQYGDIVQENFIDSYRNLSYKGIAGLRWVSTYCNHTKYVLKTDDDMFVNMYTIVQHLNNIYTANFKTHLIICYVYWKMHVFREDKWAIPKSDYPDDIYPPYCSGMGYILSMDVARALHQVSYYVKFFWVDDVFIGGLLPKALEGQVVHSEMTRAYCAFYEIDVYVHETEWYKYAFTHLKDEEVYLTKWTELSAIAKSKTIPTPFEIKPGVLCNDYIAKEILFPEQYKAAKV